MMPSSNHGRHFGAAKVIAIATGKPMMRHKSVVSAATAKLFRKIDTYSHSVARL